MNNKNKKVAIVQSNYIPWKGYFDMIAAVDEFVLFDDMQYTRRDWRNRNQIKTPQGLQWLTVPVKVKGKYFQAIRETEIDGKEWAASHWKSIELNYRKARFYPEISSLIRPLYLERNYTHLSVLNRTLIEAVCTYLGITTKISHSWDYPLVDGKTERLVGLCQQAGASEYISGPAASDYLEEELFAREDIQLTWFDYAGYQEYPQLWGDFVHSVSILDLLFNCGPESTKCMRYAAKVPHDARP
jgi:hypothetical protein